MLIWQKLIYREDLRANPSIKYLFGDNEKRVGMGGQAGQMRGEPNSVGIRTKASPGIESNAYWTDKNLTRNIALLDEDFNPVRFWLMDDARRMIVVPRDGLGTGLAMLEENAPNTLRYLNQWIEHLRTIR